MTNKVLRQASTYANYLAEKARFFKPNKKLVGARLSLNFSYNRHKSL